MDRALRQFVRQRAGNRCEYCLLPQELAGSIRFHVEHIQARQHGGNESAENLALACPNCNWHKGPNLSAIDPETQATVPIFHPRQDSWDQHFARVDVLLEGKSATGRATLQLLRMNAPERLELRRQMANLDDSIER